MASSAAVVLVLVALPRWRWHFAEGLWHDLALALTVLWALAAAIWFRRRLWGGPPPPAALSATGIDHYRAELVERRDHLRMAWAWRGPVFLALCLFVVPLATRALGAPAQLWNMAPFLAFAVIWAAIVRMQTRSTLQTLDAEIRDLDSSR